MVPGRPLTYRTTPNFLRAFGLSSLSELPPLPDSLLPEEITSENTEDENAEEDGFDPLSEALEE